MSVHHQSSIKRCSPLGVACSVTGGMGWEQGEDGNGMGQGDGTRAGMGWDRSENGMGHGAGRDKQNGIGHGMGHGTGQEQEGERVTTRGRGRSHS